MSFTSRTIENEAVKHGKSYFWAAENDTLAIGGTLKMYMETINDLEVYLRSIILDSNSEQLTWQVYSGVEVSGGTPIGINSRNSGASNKKPIKAILDPTIDTAGTPLFPSPRLVLGQTAPGNNSFLYQEVLTGGYIIPKSSKILVEVTNTSAAEVVAQILVSGRENI